MNKYLLALATTAALMPSAYAEENVIYLRGEGGAAMFGKEKDTPTELKMKSKASGNIGFGAGYYVTDKIRGEVLYVHVFNPELKASSSKLKFENIEYKNANVKHKGKVGAVMFKGYFDAIDFNYGKAFAGLGLGWAQVGETTTYAGTEVTTDTKTTFTAKSKNKNNAAFSVTIGAGFELAEGVVGDIRYEYSMYGKTKSCKYKPVIGDVTSDQEFKNANGTRYDSHNITAGIRFNI